MKNRDIIELLEKLAPKELACGWDNTGLQAGSLETEFTGVYIALDATPETVQDAIGKGCSLLVTHHPLLFSPVSSVTDQTVTGRMILAMIRAGLSCYSMHTSYDKTVGGMADAAAKRLGLTDCIPLEEAGEDGSGIGRVGRLSFGRPVNVREFARQAFREDLERMEHTPGHCYNFHPGSHVGQGVEVGIEKITEILNEALYPEMRTTVLLETMAGKGSEVGGTFEDLRAILDGVALQEHMGVCFDTCHVWDAGYDIVNNLDGVLTEFDNIIGLKKIRAVHLNNSRNDIGSHKDRHEKIDQGYLPLDAIRRIISHEALRDLPFILETPNEDEGYAREIRLLHELRGE